VLIIATFFVVHWTAAALMQSFFLHRYSAHGQFSLSKGWEKFFYLATYVALGSSFLPPRGYALLHRQHHAYSDTPRDPHSPSNHPSPVGLMLATRRAFDDLATRRVAPEPRFEGGYPEWPRLDRLGWWLPGQVAWAVAYTLFYIAFAPTPWLYLLIPVHILMGPFHGFLVNWCGHRYGYRNFETRDDSRNVLPIELLVMGEMMQNNHHRHPMRTSFAVRRFELDPTGAFIALLTALGIARPRKGAAAIEAPDIAMVPQPST
jgi:stearoyl-CoA desaturase (Delta-9 desaturase)